MADGDDTTDERGKPTRYFTPAQAEALLPEMAERITGISDRIRRARTLADTVRSLIEGSAEHGQMVDDIDVIRAEIEKLVEEIHDEGVEVKGLQPGLLDFPALMNGREVYLCWKEGESRIEHWHPTHTGIQGRQRLDPKAVGQWEWEN